MQAQELAHRGLDRRLLVRINDVRVVDPLHRIVRRDDDDIHPIRLPQLVPVMDARSRHARRLREHVEQALVRDGRHGAVLLGESHVLLCFQCLVQAVLELVVFQDPRRLGVQQLHLALAHNVILVQLQRKMCVQREVDVAHQRDVLLVEDIIAAKIPLRLRNALIGEPDTLVLHLQVPVPRERRDEAVRGTVQVGLDTGRAGYDERRHRHVHEDGIRLVDDDEVERAHVTLLRGSHEVVQQVIEAERAARRIDDVAVVDLLLARIGHLAAVLVAADAQRQTHPVEQLRHLIAVADREVAVHRDEEAPLSGQRVEI